MTKDWEIIINAMEIEAGCAHWKRKAAEHIVYPYRISMRDIKTYVYDAVISRMYVRHKRIDDGKRKPEENDLPFGVPDAEEEESIDLPTAVIVKRAAVIAQRAAASVAAASQNEQSSSAAAAAAKVGDTQQQHAVDDDDDDSDVGDLDSFLDGIEDLLNEDGVLPEYM